MATMVVFDNGAVVHLPVNVVDIELNGPYVIEAVTWESTDRAQMLFGRTGDVAFLIHLHDEPQNGPTSSQDSPGSPADVPLVHPDLPGVPDPYTLITDLRQQVAALTLEARQASAALDLANAALDHEREHARATHSELGSVRQKLHEAQGLHLADTRKIHELEGTVEAQRTSSSITRKMADNLFGFLRLLDPDAWGESPTLEDIATAANYGAVFVQKLKEGDPWADASQKMPAVAGRVNWKAAAQFYTITQGMNLPPVELPTPGEVEQVMDAITQLHDTTRPWTNATNTSTQQEGRNHDGAE